MNLRFLRIQAGKTITEVAEAAGFSKQRYFYIETKGDVYSMDEHTARKVADALGKNLFEICDEDVLRFKPRTKAEKDLLLGFIDKIEVSA